MQRSSGKLRTVPLTLAQANELIVQHHRHHKPAQGHRFSVGALREDKLVGAVIVGRPVARYCDPDEVAEVTRLVTDGTRNTCSFLYSTAARIAKYMGFKKIQTYILEEEPGTSLKAAGWRMIALTDGKGNWNSRAGRRMDQPTCRKQRWERKLNE